MAQQISEIKSRGFITLVSVLLLAALSVTITSSLILLGLGSSRTGFALEQSNQVKALANACAEEALQQINSFTPFSGTGSLSIGQGSCSYTVTKLTGQNRTIIASGLVGTIIRKISISIDKINPDINITSWQEVTDF